MDLEQIKIAAYIDELEKIANPIDYVNDKVIWPVTNKIYLSAGKHSHMIDKAREAARYGTLAAWDAGTGESLLSRHAGPELVGAAVKKFKQSGLAEKIRSNGVLKFIARKI
jgi:hypothetical protein